MKKPKLPKGWRWVPIEYELSGITRAITTVHRKYDGTWTDGISVFKTPAEAKRAVEAELKR